MRRDDTVVMLEAGAVPVSLWHDDTFDAVVGVVSEPGGELVPRAPQRREPATLPPWLRRRSPSRRPLPRFRRPKSRSIRR